MPAVYSEPDEKTLDQHDTGAAAVDDLEAIDALLSTADAEQIWRVLDYAREHAVPVAHAYRKIIGELRDCTAS